MEKERTAVEFDSVSKAQTQIRLSEFDPGRISAFCESMTQMLDFHVIKINTYTIDPLDIRFTP